MTPGQYNALKAGLIAVRNMIDESDGIYGLHLNGDVSPWESLRSVGRFGEWLHEFDTALEVIESIDSLTPNSDPTFTLDDVSDLLIDNIARSSDRFGQVHAGEASIHIERHADAG